MNQTAAGSKQATEIFQRIGREAEDWIRSAPDSLIAPKLERKGVAHGYLPPREGNDPAHVCGASMVPFDGSDFAVARLDRRRQRD
jgi:hypothetical protein